MIRNSHLEHRARAMATSGVHANEEGDEETHFEDLPPRDAGEQQVPQRQCAGHQRQQPHAPITTYHEDQTGRRGKAHEDDLEWVGSFVLAPDPLVVVPYSKGVENTVDSGPSK